VRDYARGVVRAHSARQTELSRVLRDKGLTPPNSPSATDKRRLARLSALRRGTAFERAYIREAVRINQEDRTAARREARLTRDRDIQDYLRRFAPTDQAQLRGALALRR
jgi:predicted outer membrane protein